MNKTSGLTATTQLGQGQSEVGHSVLKVILQKSYYSKSD